MLFTILGKNVSGRVGVFVCDRVSLFSLLFKFLYIGVIALLSFSSMAWKTLGHGIHQVFASDMCRW